MPGRPQLQNGYLGQQPKFGDLGLSTLSHPQSEITIDTNSLEIKLKFNPNDKVKVTHQLINCQKDKDNEESEYVFTQTEGDVITFLISLQCAGYYKFQIFALPSKDDSKSLPNVFNYLINCTSALHPCFPYPKQYAQWKDGCNLRAPLCLHKDMPCGNVDFNVNIPDANGVAVVAGGEWFHLKKNGCRWEGSFNFSAFQGKETKVTLNANMVPDETKYSTMLEYNI